MPKYVLQIITEGKKKGYLIKSFEVSEKHGIPEKVPVDRQQIIISNKRKFNAVVKAFEKYGGENVDFFQDTATLEIKWKPKKKP